MPKLLEKRRVRIRERERWMPGLGWDKEYLFYTDGGAAAGWQEVTDETRGEDVEECDPPGEYRPERGWVWLKGSAWEIEAREGHTDVDGWRYGWNVTEKNWSAKCGPHHFVRKRYWMRECIFDPVAYLSGVESDVKSAKRRPQKEPVVKYYEVYENERWVLMSGFSPKHLLPTDRPQWTVVKGPAREDVRNPKLNENWEWAGEWEVCVDGPEADEKGWSYSWNFGMPNWHAKCSAGDFVRRRKWRRAVKFTPPPEFQIGAGGAAGDQAHEANLGLITSNRIQEVVSGELEVAEAEREELIQEVNAVLTALLEEEQELSSKAQSTLNFLEVARKTMAATATTAHSKALTCDAAAPLGEWLKMWKARTHLAPLTEEAGSADLTKRCRELEYRIGLFLQARANLTAADEALRPGATGPDPPSELGDVKYDLEEDEEQEL